MQLYLFSSYSSPWQTAAAKILVSSNRDAPTVDSVRLGGIVHQMQRVTMQIDGCDPYLDHLDRIDEGNAGVGIYKYLLHPQTAPSILHNAATKTLLPT
jgi:hypothetical protein